MPFKESKEYWREPHNPPHTEVDLYHSEPELQQRLLDHINKSVPQGHLEDAIAQIDIFAKNNWMMNLGPEKAKIIYGHGHNRHIKNILQLGAYCGYSALQFAKIFPQATIHSIEISAKYAEIARKIEERAGVAQRIHIHVGVVSSLQQNIKNLGPFDLIFIDHAKNHYLSDFKILQKLGVIKKGTLVIGDNIITPGSPEYLQNFKQNKYYDSVLEHSYLEYCDIQDAVLVSQKIEEPELEQNEKDQLCVA